MFSFRNHKDKAKIGALVVNEEGDIKPIYVHNDMDGYKIPNPFSEYEAKSDEMILPTMEGKGGYFNFYCSGPSGSGKSYAIQRMIKLRQKYHKDDRPIITFNPNPDDYQDLETKQVDLSVLEEGDLPDISEFADSIIIFDDVFYIANRNIKKKVIDFMNEVLTTGRHHNISSFITSHVPADGPNTKHCINESNCLMLFRGGNAAQKRYIYETKIGIDDKKKINDLVKNKSRYVMVHKHFPKYIVTKDKVEMVDD